LLQVLNYLTLGTKISNFRYKKKTPTFIDPGADAEAKLWAEIVQDAESMPKAEAGKARHLLP
jgi:hypothetical protein